MTRFVIFLTLSEYSSMTPGALEMAFGAGQFAPLVNVRAPGGPKFDPLPDSNASGEACVVMADQQPVSIVFVDAPLPQKSWEWPIKLDQVWPEGENVLRASRAHIVIAGLKAQTTHADTFDLALANTLIAAQLAKYLPVTAAIFVDAQSLATPAALQEGAVGLLNQQVPTELWSSVQFFSAGEGRAQKVGALTYGLEAFIGRELEFQPAALDVMAVAERVFGLSQYLITQGPVIEDGQTVGLSATERINARHLSEGRRAGVPILELAI